MPVCVLSDVTTGHPENAAKIYIFENVHSHCIKCGISNSFIYFCMAGMEIYKSMYTNTNIHALGVVIPFNSARCSVFCNIDKIIALVCSTHGNVASAYSDVCMNCFHNVLCELIIL